MTDQMKHTPGPWSAEDGGWVGFSGSWCVVGPDYCGIADITPTAPVAKYPRDMEANARLISAAPDLLAACEALLAIDGGRYCTVEMRAAIAKATPPAAAAGEGAAGRAAVEGLGRGEQ